MQKHNPDILFKPDWQEIHPEISQSKHPIVQTVHKLFESRKYPVWQLQQFVSELQLLHPAGHIVHVDDPNAL